jgi:hypothetical protein
MVDFGQEVGRALREAKLSAVRLVCEKYLKDQRAYTVLDAPVANQVLNLFTAATLAVGSSDAGLSDVDDLLFPATEGQGLFGASRGESVRSSVFVNKTVFGFLRYSHETRDKVLLALDQILAPTRY